MEEEAARRPSLPRRLLSLLRRRLRRPRPRRRRRTSFLGPTWSRLRSSPRSGRSAPRSLPARKPKRRSGPAREAELVGEAEEEPSAASRAPAKIEGDARFLATGKRKTLDRPRHRPSRQRQDRGQQARARGVLPAAPAPDDGPPAPDDHRLRGQRRRPRPRPRRRHQRPGRRGSPRDRPGADRGRPRAARRAQAPRLPDPRRAGQGAQKAGLKKARKRPQFSKR